MSSYDWEDKSNGGPKFTCDNCHRNDTHGAVFQYHELGVKTPNGFGYTNNMKKLPSQCTECLDKLHNETGVPYYWLDLYISASKVFDFYAKSVELRGGNVDQVNQYKSEIVKAHIKQCDNDLGESIQNKTDKDEMMPIQQAAVDKFIANIAGAGEVSVAGFTNNHAKHK